MAGRSTQWQVTPYLVFLIFIVTLGPLQFGYHLVRMLMPEERERQEKGAIA